MATFAEIERDGWNDRADSYETTTARATTQAIPALLNAVLPRYGEQVLDICTGPGYAAGAAAAIGCDVTGVDFAPEMVKTAARRFADCAFVTGDATAMDLDADSFDAVICNFGVFHFDEPEKAMGEAARVLRPGGRFAWSQWLGPDKSAFFAAVFEAVSTHADMNVGLPPAPPPFRFSDPAAANSAMHNAGFADITITEVPIILPAPADGFMDYFRKFSVRVTMILERQEKAVFETIRNEIETALRPFAKGDTLQVPMPAMVISGRLPA